MAIMDGTEFAESSCSNDMKTTRASESLNLTQDSLGALQVDHPTNDPDPAPAGIESSIYIRMFQELMTGAEERLQSNEGRSSLVMTSATQSIVIPIKRSASEMLGNLGEKDDEKDDDDELENLDEELKHDPTSEDMPRQPIYHPACKWIELFTHRLINILLQVIKDQEYNDDDTKYILKELMSKDRPAYGEAIRVVFEGVSGVGKSSLLSSVFGMENITMTNDDGEACTNVVQEFMYASPTQTDACQAEIGFFCSATCDKKVTDMLAYYVKHAVKLARDEEPSEQEAKNAQTTLENLVGLFRNHEEFEDQDAAIQFLSTATTPNDPQILKKLRQWTDDIRSQLVPDGTDKLILHDQTMQSLVARILPLIKTVSNATFNGKPLGYSPWPFVRIARYRFRDLVLEQNVIVGDTPGTSDINQTRVESAQEYKQICDHSLVVGKIDRARSDAPFFKHFLEALKRRGRGSAALVCTRSDDITVPKSTKGKENEFSPTDLEHLNLLAKSIDSTNAMISEAKLDIDQVRGNIHSVVKVSRRIQRLEQRLAKLKQERQEVCIKARNDKVVKGLITKYRMQTKDVGRVTVICASNRAYMQHVTGYKKDELPVMQLPNTGVPTVRSYLYALPCKGKFASLEHYCHTVLPTLLSTIEMSCSVSKLKRQDHLVNIVLDARKVVRAKISGEFDKFNRVQVGNLLELMNSLQGQWITHGETLCDKYAKEYKPAAHAAFIRNKGSHSTAKVKAADSNKEFLVHIPKHVDEAFEAVRKVIGITLRADIFQAISDVIKSMDTQLRAMLSGALRIFLTNLQGRQNEVNREVEQMTNSLDKYFKGIAYKATTDGESHFFTRAIAEIYDDAFEVQGVKAIKATRNSPGVKAKTKHVARCEFFKAAICAPEGPYFKILEDSRLMYDVFLNRERERLELKVGAIFRKIQHDFKTICKTKDDDSPKGIKFRELMASLIEPAREVLNGPVKECLEIARQYK